MKGLEREVDFERGEVPGWRHQDPTEILASVRACGARVLTGAMDVVDGNLRDRSFTGAKK